MRARVDVGSTCNNTTPLDLMNIPCKASSYRRTAHRVERSWLAAYTIALEA